MKHALPLYQPMIELLNSAATFGSDFDGDGDPQHLAETLENVRSLYNRASCAARTLRRVSPRAREALSFLTEIMDDLSVIERTIENHIAERVAAAA